MESLWNSCCKLLPFWNRFRFRYIQLWLSRALVMPVTGFVFLR
jgi:hypothetical protein